METSMPPAPHQRLRRLACGWALLAGLTSGVWAQGAYLAPSGSGADNLDWKEDVVPPAPAFSQDGGLRLDMPRHISVRVGIDPATIRVGADGVVRYVAIMRNSSGSVNAMYEGIRCATDEVKTYARVGSSGQWSALAEPAWKPVNSGAPSPHAWVFARQAACPGKLANSRDEIIRALTQPARASKASES